VGSIDVYILYMYCIRIIPINRDWSFSFISITVAYFVCRVIVAARPSRPSLWDLLDILFLKINFWSFFIIEICCRYSLTRTSLWTDSIFVIMPVKLGALTTTCNYKQSCPGSCRSRDFYAPPPLKFFDFEVIFTIIYYMGPCTDNKGKNPRMHAHVRWQNPILLDWGLTELGGILRLKSVIKTDHNLFLS